MEKRKQFTFYRSYCRSIENLKPKDQLAIFRAIMYYALDGTEPTDMNAAQKAVFYLIQPVLDTGRKRAEAGRIGGSKPKANHKQTPSEVEIEKEIDTDIEDESLKGTDGFERFWQIYPVKIAPVKARELWDEGKREQILEGLKRWLESAEWKRENGRFIPRAWRFLQEQMYAAAPTAQPPCGAMGALGQAELDAIAQVLREED